MREGHIIMYTKEEKQKQFTLYLLTSLSFLFSIILVSVIKNAFYQSDIVPWGFLSAEEEISNKLYTSFFNAFKLTFSFVPFVISVLIYNSLCSEPKFVSCKVEPLCCLYGAGIMYVGNLLSWVVVTPILGILFASGYQGPAFPYPANLLTPSFYYLPNCIVCTILNIFFWILYFKRKEKALQKNLEAECAEENRVTVKDASVHALLITVLTLLAFIANLFISGIDATIWQKMQSSTTYIEYCFYGGIIDILYSAPELALILFSIFLHNLILKKCKASYFGFSYTVTSINLSSIISNLLLVIIEVVLYYIFFNIQDFYESTNNINSASTSTGIVGIIQLIAFFIISMLIWFFYFKQKLNVSAAEKASANVQYVGTQSSMPYYNTNTEPQQQSDGNNIQQPIIYVQSSEQRSEKSRGVAAVLCFFFGTLGIHRFYVGKIGTGLLWMFTLGFFGIGDIIDFFMIICGSFKDSEGRKL